jgi:pyrroloquinoline quinone biosynthesis protein E
MSILALGDDTNVPRLDFELMTGCDHSCGHCYNVWNARPDDPQGGYKRGMLRSEEFLALMSKAVEQTGADHITITGGEPLLRKDAMEIMERACSLVSRVQLITNGSHVPPRRAKRLGELDVKSVQLTILSAEPEKHNRLKGADCFDSTLRAALDLRDAGVPVQVCFVAMKQNWRDFAEVMELCYVLGVRAISYNRMSPAGGAIHEVADLLPDVEHVEANLDVAEKLGRKYGIRVATAMPIPPCLIRLDRYEWVQFGFCSTGSSSPNIVIDPMGNVRSCNLASGILGNLAEEDWPAIWKRVREYQSSFKKAVPDMCKGCRYETSCQGGCKESGFAMFGDTREPEPFVRNAIDPDWQREAAAKGAAE